MKNILFILSLIIWCSCSNEILFDIDKVGDIVTRAVNSDSAYYFEGYFNQLQPIVTLPHKKDSIRQTIVSYREVGTTATDINPEVVSKPAWVNRIDFMHPYYKIYEVFISVDCFVWDSATYIFLYGISCRGSKNRMIGIQFFH